MSLDKPPTGSSVLFASHLPFIKRVGLDSGKRTCREKMGNDVKRGKEAIRYGKRVYMYDIKEFYYFSGIQIWQYDKLNVLCTNDDATENSFCNI